MNTRTLGIIALQPNGLFQPASAQPFKTPSDVQIAPVVQAVAMFDEAIQTTTESITIRRTGKQTRAPQRQGDQRSGAGGQASILGLHFELGAVDSAGGSHHRRPAVSDLWPTGRITRILDSKGDQETVMLHRTVRDPRAGQARAAGAAPIESDRAEVPLTKDAKFDSVVKVTKY